jgi:hypothetical protein
MPETSAKEKAAFWFFGENESDYGRQPERLKQLRALLFYGLLYEPCLVVSDSFLVNNLNLRRVLREDREAQLAVAGGLIRVACRCNAGSAEAVPLTDTRDNYLRRINAVDWGGSTLAYFPRDEYAETRELDLLAQRGRLIPFSLPEVGNRYTTGVREFIRNEANATDILGRDAAGVLLGLVEQEVSRNNGMLLRAFFYDERLRKEIDTRLSSPGGWNRFGPMIQKIANGFYATALPDLIETNPLYPDLHAAAIELQRRRQRNRTVEAGKQWHSIQSRLSPADFVESLQHLWAQDVLVLHESDEWRHYRQALLNLSDRQTMLLAYRDYRRKIEEVIIEHLGDPMRNPHFIQLESADYLVGSQADASSTQEFVQCAFNEADPTGCALPLVRNLYQRTPRRHRIDPELQQQLAEEALSRLQRQGGGLIRATTHVEADFHATEMGIAEN